MSRPRETAFCYALFGIMLVLATANLRTTPRGSMAKWALLISLLLTVAGASQAKDWGSLLGRREAELAQCVLVMFCAGQVVHFLASGVGSQAKHGVDFSAYYLAGKALQERPTEGLYDLPMFADGRMDLNTEDSPGTRWHALAQREHVPFAAPYIYPPFLAGFVAPLAQLPFAQALFAWNLLTTVLTLAGVLLSFAVAGVRADGELALIAGVGLFSFFPFLNNLFFGQMGGVILFLFAAGVWFLSRRWIWLSALCFAVATLIKLTPAIVVPLLLLHRYWRWLAAYMAWCTGLLLLSVWMVGAHAYMEFWHMVLPAMGCGSAVWENTTVVSWVQQFLMGSSPFSSAPSHAIPAYACSASKAVALVLYVVFLFQCWRRRRDLSVEASVVAVALLGLAVSPISWWHHYTIALLPLIYLWWETPDGIGRRCLAALGLLVGTNVVGLAGELVGSGVRLALGIVVPLLTAAAAFIAISVRQNFDDARV